VSGITCSKYPIDTSFCSDFACFTSLFHCHERTLHVGRCQLALFIDVD